MRLDYVIAADVVPRESTPISDIRKATESDRREKDRLRKAALEAFAKLNGWEVSKGFTFSQLARRSNSRRRDEYCLVTPITDHARFLRDGRIPVAIVGQPYAPWSNAVQEEIAELNKGGQLKVHAAPALYASFYFPGHAAFFVITRPETRVRWLPEQAEEWSLLAIHDSEWPT